MALTGETTDQTCIYTIQKRKCSTQSIEKIAHILFYVYENSLITEVVDSFHMMDEEVAAVAVLGKDGKAIGLIEQMELSALLSRPYGRDVLRKKTAGEMAGDVKRYSVDMNIFSVAEEIDEDMKASGISYYLLVDDKNNFRGIFSTRGMLIYLSNLTTQDISIARRLQSRIVREKEYIETENVEIVTCSIPAKGVGGDFYTVHKYNDTNWFICICDVSGKGVAASVLTSVLWGMLSIYDFTRGLKTLVKELNHYIVQTFEGEKFVTAIFLDYNEFTGKTIICDMGHSHIFSYRKDKLFKLKTNLSNLPVGIVPDMEPSLNMFQLQNNDLLFLLTDGLIEQAGIRNKAYSIKRVEKIISEHPNSPLEEIRDNIVTDFNTFRGTKQLQDDLTFVLLQYLIPVDPLIPEE